MRVLAILIAAACSSATAQTVEDPTANMTQRQRDIFLYGATQGALLRDLAERQAADQKALNDYQLTQRARIMLAGEWQGLGLTEQQAVEAAKAYVWSDSQELVTRRIRREGVMMAIERARKAYSEFDYEMADALIVAAKIVIHEQNPAVSPPPALPQSCGPPYPCVR